MCENRLVHQALQLAPPLSNPRPRLKAVSKPVSTAEWLKAEIQNLEKLLSIYKTALDAETHQQQSLF
jgi:hypothetical protein